MPQLCFANESKKKGIGICRKSVLSSFGIQVKKKPEKSKKNK
jgi:hypothetical protein